MKRVTKWGSNFITIILGIILFVTMYTAISTRISGGTPRVFGLQWYEVMSGSMEPEIQTGSVIFDKPNFNVSNLKVGDVITFKAPDQEFGADKMIITHRINKVEHTSGQLMFQTKGDANDSPDPSFVPASNVVAKYANLTIPYLGYYLAFSRTKLGIGLMVVLPGVLLIVSAMVSLIREILHSQKRAKSEASTQTSVDKPSP